MSVASAAEVALMSVDEKVRRASTALAEIEGEGGDARLNASALADEIDRRSGVGFEAATLVVLSAGR